MRGWALTIALAMGMAGAVAPAAAQGRWQQPGGLFSIVPPAGWAVRESAPNQWAFEPPDAKATVDAACNLTRFRDAATAAHSPDQLGTLIQSRSFARMWRERLAASLVEPRLNRLELQRIAGRPFQGFVAIGRVRSEPANAGPVAMIQMVTALPGYVWRIGCVIAEEDMPRAGPIVSRMIATLQISEVQVPMGETR